MTGRVGIICARGGSKGVPGKNSRDFLGRPLIAWSIGQLVASGTVDLIAVSSDDPEILRISAEAGADVLVDRPGEMATDEAPVLPALMHAVEVAEEKRGGQFSTIVYLQATSPVRLPSDVVRAVGLFDQASANTVVSGCTASHSPYFSVVEPDSEGWVCVSKTLSREVVRRQDAPECYQLNGSIYVLRRSVLFEERRILGSKSLVYEMPEERSVDIDTQFDWRIAELAMNMLLLEGAVMPPYPLSERVRRSEPKNKTEG